MLDFKDIKFLFKIRYIQKIEKKYQHQGRHHVHFFGEGRGLCKSWASYPGQYSDFNEGAKITK